MRPLLRVAAVLVIGTSVSAQSGTIPVPEQVRAEGVPPMPAALADKLRPYASFRTAQVFSWHPTRDEILIGVGPGRSPRVHVVPSPAAPPRPFAEAVAGSASYGAQSGDAFIYRKDAAGAETQQIYRYDPAADTSTLLTDGKSRNGIPVWSRRTNRIAFDSNRLNGKDRDLYIVDVTKADGARLVSQGSGSWFVADWSPDDKRLLAVEMLPGNDTSLWEIEIESGKRLRLTDDAQPAIWYHAHYSPDGRAIYAVSNRGSEVPRVWRRSGAKWTALTRNGDAVETAAVSPDGLTLAVVFDRDAASRLELFDTRTMKVRVIAKLPAGQIWSDPGQALGLVGPGILQWNRSGSDVAFSFGSLVTFSDVFSVKASSGAITRWTRSVTGFDPAALPDPEIVKWKSFDGRKISGVLYRPPAGFTGPRPVIINIHGGPNDARERPRFQGRSGYFLNDQGIAIIYPNVRGSFGFGKSFEKLDDHRNREDAVKDIGALLDWIATQKYLDSKRVMVTGSSYGGYMTYAVAQKYPERIRCAYAAAAISDFVSYLEKTEASRVEDRRAEYGDERDPAMRTFLSGISPLTRAATTKVPLLIAHGKNDPRVPVAQAESMYQAAKGNNVPVWLLVFAEDGHELRSSVASNFHFYAWITFAEKFLLN